MKNRIGLIFCIIGLIIVYSPLIGNDPRGATDYPFSFIEQIQTLLNLPFTWSSTIGNLGQNVTTTMWSWPVTLIFGIGARFGLGFEVLQRIFGVLPVILIGYFGMNKLCKLMKISSWGRYIAIFFYLTNSYLLLLVDGGQLSIAAAYSLIPFIFSFIAEKPINSLKNKISLSLLIVLLSIFDPRFIYIIFILVIVHIISQIFILKSLEIKEIIKHWIIWVFVSAVIFVGLNSYWLIPQMSSNVEYLPQSYKNVTQVSSLSFATTLHAMFLQQPHWYQNIFGNIQDPYPGFVLIPVIAFGALTLTRRDKRVVFWMIIALIGIFLTKGSNPPFGSIYTYLFTYLPGFVFFRDPTKFFFLVTLSYSVLMGITVSSFGRLRGKYLSNFVSNVAPVIIFIYLLLLTSPVYLGKMTGIFSALSFKSDYLKLADQIRSDNSYSRVLWLQDRPPLAYSSYLHPVIGGVGLLNYRPFAISTLGSYEKTNFLREAKYTGELLDVLGVSSLVYTPLDPKRGPYNDDNKKYHELFLNQLMQLPWIKDRTNFGDIMLLNTKKHQDHIFLTDNIWMVIGSDDIYKQTSTDGPLNLANNSLIFLEEGGVSSNLVFKIPEAKIVLNNKTILDLTLSFIDKSMLIFPAQYLNSSPDTHSWWKRDSGDYINWRDFLVDKYNIHNQDFDLGGGWAISEYTEELNIPYKVSDNSKLLFARVLESSQSGSLKFYQDDKLINKIDTYSEDANLRWFRVGKLSDGKTIKIIPEGNLNVVNALTVINENDFKYLDEQTNKYKSRIKPFLSEEVLSDSKPEMIYKQINPTKFEIDISGLKKPEMLVFSEAFDPLWQLNERSSERVYSMLNGFYIQKDGKYILEFKPQRSIPIGLLISGVFVLILTSFYLWVIKSNME